MRHILLPRAYLDQPRNALIKLVFTPLRRSVSLSFAPRQPPRKSKRAIEFSIVFGVDKQGKSQDHEKGGLGLRGVAVTTTTATTAETAKTVKTATVASLYCIL